MKTPLLLSISLCLAISACGEPQQTSQATQSQSPDYLNTNLDIDTRVDDLVARMTVAEKISQMYNDAPAIERLGVPAYDWWNEALHGVARAGKATVFPQAIGMAAMWDRNTMHEIATVVSDEARAKHHYYARNGVIYRYTGLTFWSPNINIFRDPRWGRGQETYGEDPFLTGELAHEYIRGLQGDHEKYLKTAAMAKHYAVHSGPEKSRHSDNYYSSPKDLYETYLPAFEKAVVKSNVEAIMCAYNRVNDDPACGSDMLLKEVLRGKFGFQGHVVSDCGAIADFYDPNAHNLVMAPAEAAAWAVRSGTDLNCGTARLSTYANLHFALQKGMISEAEIDTAVKRLFKTRFKLGMFDPEEQVPFTRISMDVVGAEAHLALAQKAAEKSFVLLKNDGLLPLDKNLKVAVIGPNATNPTILVGNYHGVPIQPVTPLAGIQTFIGKQNVFHAPGSSVAAEQYGHFDVVPPEVFFHRDEHGNLKPGLVTTYYDASSKNGRAAEAEFSRVEPNIDFYQMRSPVNDTVYDEFATDWQGILIPKESGTFKFKTRESIFIDGEEIKNTVTLQAGREYTFKASQDFVRNKWRNPKEPFARVSWFNTSRNLVSEAVAAASKADVIIFTGGISADLEGEEMRYTVEGFDYGDRLRIDLPDVQKNLLEILHALGKPMVLVNFSGSAMALNWEDKNMNAILQGFYPGEATGTALARILWGEVSPAGRLPVTFYRGLDDLPGFKDYDMQNRTYKYYKGDVLYPFGYGLSYSKFSYSDLNAPKSLSPGSDLIVSAKVSNSGNIASDEVVQVYTSMPDAENRVPLRELKAFQRIHLAPGDSKTVELKINAADLRYIDIDGGAKQYTGKLELSLGAGQANYLQSGQYVKTQITIQ